MKYYELDKEEKALVKALEKGELKNIATKADLKRHTSYAKANLNRTRNINIRLSEHDLQKIKAKAAEKGIPYQTLVTSLLHQYGTSTKE